MEDKIYNAIAFTFIMGLIMGLCFGLLIGYFACKKPQQPTETAVLEQQQPTEWDLLFFGIVSVGSEFNLDAKNGKHVGYIQARQQYIDDANRILGRNEFTAEDRHDITRCKEMFNVIQGHYNPECDFIKASKIHYMGAKGYKNNPDANDWYVRRVNREVEKFKVLLSAL